MSAQLSADQIAELKKAFEVMDANKDGEVTKDSWPGTIGSSGVSVNFSSAVGLKVGICMMASLASCFLG